MRILLISNSYLPQLGGVESVTHNLALYLKEKEHIVQVVSNRYPRYLQSQEVIDGINIKRWLFIRPKLNDLKRRRVDIFAASLYFFPFTLYKLRRLLKKFRPDVVNLHFPDHQIPFILYLRRQFKFRLVISLHGHEVLRRFEQESIYLNKSDDLKVMLQKCDAVTACSRFLLDKAGEIEPAVTAKGHVIHNGIDPERFSDKKEYSHLRPYIFAFGRLTPHKGFDMLLTAFAKAVKHSMEPDLILAGEGEEKHNLQLQIVQFGLEKRVHLFGRATPEEVVRLLNGCQLAVLSSRREPFGIAALEALAAGKPVLATRVGGLPEFVQGSANQLVEPTAKGISKGLQTWFQQRDKMKSLAVQNRLRAAEFTWEKMVDRYLELYQNCKE